MYVRQVTDDLRLVSRYQPFQIERNTKMNFKQIMMEKLKANVAYKVANDSTLIHDVAGAVLDDLDYTEIASEINISSSDIACEIDHSDILSDITEHLDMDDIKQILAEKCDLNTIAGKVITMLPDTFMDDLAEYAADEIVKEMADSCRI
jgi:hypothetical protein